MERVAGMELVNEYDSIKMNTRWVAGEAGAVD